MSKYIVKRGDTLSKIAQANGMTLEELMKLNNISADKADYIQVGQELKLRDTNSDKPQVTIDPNYRVPRLVFDPGQDGTALKQRPQPLSQPTTQTLQPKPVDQATYLKNNAKAVQQQLFKLGYSLGKYGVDGNWGNASQAAFDQAIKDGYVFKDGKFISTKPMLKSKTPPRTFDEAMQQTPAYQRRQMIEQFSEQANQITQTPVQTPVTQTSEQPIPINNRTYFLSEDNHPVNLNWINADKTRAISAPVGHAANVIIDDKGQILIYEYGRYNDDKVIGYNKPDEKYTGIFGKEKTRKGGNVRFTNLGSVNRFVKNGTLDEQALMKYIADSKVFDTKQLSYRLTDRPGIDAINYWQNLANNKERDVYSGTGNNCVSTAARASGITGNNDEKPGEEGFWMPMFPKAFTLFSPDRHVGSVNTPDGLYTDTSPDYGQNLINK